MSRAQALKDDLDEFGHLHVVMSEEVPPFNDATVEMSQGTVEWDEPNDSAFTLKINDEKYRYFYEEVVAVEMPHK